MLTARIESVDWTERPVVMRLPFRFGNTEMRETGEAHCTLRAVIDGREVTGRSAQLMVPRWFDKRAEQSNADTIDTLRESVTAACAAAPGMDGPAAALARDLRSAMPARMTPGTPRLAAGFGPALVEMALIDALCRAAGLPFWKAAQADIFGLAAHLPADLSADALAAALDRIEAPREIRIRHTIGYDAPLSAAEIGPDAPRDGLPVSVDQVIAAHGVTAFKIKLKGDPDPDLARLRAIGATLDPLPGYTATLDANEQYAPDAFAALRDGLARDPALARLRAALRFVEQPFAREEALNVPDVAGYGLPLVIDESDDHDDAMAEALAAGWAGCSIKSCKGVLRALLNRARAEATGAMLSGEDLTCQPGLCWQQDTAMAAACGVPDIERNGHHFAGGMQGAPGAEIAARLAAHPDIYTTRDGRPVLAIRDGRVAIGSLDAPGFGHPADT